MLKDLLGFVPQEKLKYEFATFLDKLVCIIYFCNFYLIYKNIKNILHFRLIQLNPIEKILLIKKNY